MRGRCKLKIDFFGNVTSYKCGSFWVAQEFMGVEIIGYSDSDGSYWDKEWGVNFPYFEYFTSIEMDTNDKDLLLETSRVNGMIEVSHWYRLDLQTYDLVSAPSIIGPTIIPPVILPTVVTKPPMTIWEKILNKLKNK